MVSTLLFLSVAFQGADKPAPSKLPRTDLRERIGQMAPDFTVVGRNGKPIRLRDLRGKTVVLDFWATWCQPCQMTMPGLERLRARTQAKEVVFLSVNEWDDREPYEAWIKANAGTRYGFTFAFDASGKDRSKGVAPRFGATGLPTLFVIDKKGRIAEVSEGYWPVDGNKREDVKIEAALVKDGARLEDEK